MSSRPLCRLQAFLLAAPLAALSSGAPSHFHERSDVGPIVVDLEHHGHASQLVELCDRQPSDLVSAPLPATVFFELPEEGASVDLTLLPAPRPVAGGPPPTADRPRAPPVSA